MNNQDIREHMRSYDQVLNNKELTPFFPKTMLLEVSNICNHACAFCANSKSDRKKGFIEKKFAMQILSEAIRLYMKRSIWRLIPTARYYWNSAEGRRLPLRIYQEKQK